MNNTLIHDLDSDLSEFLLEGQFENTSSDRGSDDSMDYDACVDAEGIFLPVNDEDCPARSLTEEFHALHRPNFAERTTVYLEKLYSMLEQCPESIATWTQDGSSFAILDNEALEKTIIPRYFKPIKFESFVRQLNSYGFRKAKYTINNRSVFAFRHTSFVRGQSQQLQTIKRRRRVKRNLSSTEHLAIPETTPIPSTSPPTLDVQATLCEIMNLIQTLQQDLADTKALIHTLGGGNGNQEVISL